jgi:hypothetical protein
MLNLLIPAENRAAEGGASYTLAEGGASYTLAEGGASYVLPMSRVDGEHVRG